MDFYRLISEEDQMFGTAIRLYRSSFPAHEQREEDSQKAALRQEEYHFDLIYDAGLFVGLMLYWETADFIYVEHFCIDEGLRGRRYGQRALGLLGERGKTVILEIDPPKDSQSVRRLAFYQRSGFRVNDFAHVHPPYHKGNQGHRLVVMSYPSALPRAEYERFREYLEAVVMGVSIGGR